jgi:hypothetical protein
MGQEQSYCRILCTEQPPVSENTNLNFDAAKPVKKDKEDPFRSSNV